MDHTKPKDTLETAYPALPRITNLAILAKNAATRNPKPVAKKDANALLRGT